MCLRSNIVYEFACGRCKGIYYGRICRHFIIRVGEDLVIQSIRQIKTSTAVQDHYHTSVMTVLFDSFKVLPFSNSDFHLKIMENLLISRDQPILTENEASIPLYLFE